MPAAKPPEFRRRALDLVAQGEPAAAVARNLVTSCFQTRGGRGFLLSGNLHIRRRSVGRDGSTTSLSAGASDSSMRRQSSHLDGGRSWPWLGTPSDQLFITSDATGTGALL